MDRYYNPGKLLDSAILGRGIPMTARRLLFAAVFGLSAMTMADTRPCAQESCYNAGSSGGESVEGFISKADGTCQVTAGTYVKKSTSYKIHVRATAYGGCTLRAWDCTTLPCDCVTYGTQTRGVSSVNIREYNSHSLSPFSLGNMYPVDQSGKGIVAQEMDSRVAGTTSPGGVGWSPGTALGVSTIRWTESIFTTNCNLLPSTAYTEMAVNVVDCVPRFKRNSYGNIVHLATGVIYVYINPGLGQTIGDAFRSAIWDWNAAGLPVQFQETITQCSGPYCINTDIGTVPAGSCAESTLLVQSDGTITSSMVYFPEAARTWNSGYLRRTVNHEFGHHLGLDEQRNCGTSASVMTPVACNATSGFPQSPTVTDRLPPDKTTYGGGPATSCPSAAQ